MARDVSGETIRLAKAVQIQLGTPVLGIKDARMPLLVNLVTKARPTLVELTLLPPSVQGMSSETALGHLWRHLTTILDAAASTESQISVIVAWHRDEPARHFAAVILFFERLARVLRGRTIVHLGLPTWSYTNGSLRSPVRVTDPAALLRANAGLVNVAASATSISLTSEDFVTVSQVQGIRRMAIEHWQPRWNGPSQWADFRVLLYSQRATLTTLSIQCERWAPVPGHLQPVPLPALKSLSINIYKAHGSNPDTIFDIIRAPDLRYLSLFINANDEGAPVTLLNRYPHLEQFEAFPGRRYANAAAATYRSRHGICLHSTGSAYSHGSEEHIGVDSDRDENQDEDGVEEDVNDGEDEDEDEDEGGEDDSEEDSTDGSMDSDEDLSESSDEEDLATEYACDKMLASAGINADVVADAHATNGATSLANGAALSNVAEGSESIGSPRSFHEEGCVPFTMGQFGRWVSCFRT